MGRLAGFARLPLCQFHSTSLSSSPVQLLARNGSQLRLPRTCLATSRHLGNRAASSSTSATPPHAYKHRLASPSVSHKTKNAKFPVIRGMRRGGRAVASRLASQRDPADGAAAPKPHPGTMPPSRRLPPHPAVSAAKLSANELRKRMLASQQGETRASRNVRRMRMRNHRSERTSESTASRATSEHDASTTASSDMPRPTEWLEALSSRQREKMPAGGGEAPATTTTTDGATFAADLVSLPPHMQVGGAPPTPSNTSQSRAPGSTASPSPTSPGRHDPRAPFLSRGLAQSRDKSNSPGQRSQSRAFPGREEVATDAVGWGRDRLAPAPGGEADIGTDSTSLLGVSGPSPANSSDPAASEGDVSTSPSGNRSPDSAERPKATTGSTSTTTSTSTSRRSQTRLLFGDDAQARRLVRRTEAPPLSAYNEELPAIRESAIDPEQIERYPPSVVEWWEREGKWKVPRTGKMRAIDTAVEPVAPLREMQVPALAHGLDRVLFNPGVYWLRDPRSGIYNFDPSLRKIIDVDLFDYSALPPYITSSRDKELGQIAQREGKRYVGSTSSLTGLLSQIYFLLSAWRAPDLSGFSEPFATMPHGFSFGATLPASVVLRRLSPADAPAEELRFAVDADKSSTGEVENSNYVLTQLGKAMEKRLTSDNADFDKYLRVNSHQLREEERNRPESYHYCKSDKFIMRSQLDCADPRLPNSSFDLKSRAVIAIRRDRANWVESSGYMIRRSTGLLESFERELYDMVRGAFLKYYFQARIGHMDGIFVAYHSTAAMYGFQYVPLEDMAERLFGGVDMAECSFRLAVKLLEAILDAATGLYPGQEIRLTLNTTSEAEASTLQVFVEPVTGEGQDGAEAASSAPQPEASSAEHAPAEETVASTANAGDAAASLDAQETDRNEADDADAPPPRPRKVILLNLVLDRYLDGGLVQGRVDFEAVEGRRVDDRVEDEIERRRREQMPPVLWEVEYKLTPQFDLDEVRTRAKLDAIRSRQVSANELILPNVSALNRRDAEREAMLAVNPAALHRFREDQRVGKAVAMPRPPPNPSSSPSPSPQQPSETTAVASASRGGAPAAPTPQQSSRVQVAEGIAAEAAADPSKAEASAGVASRANGAATATPTSVVPQDATHTAAAAATAGQWRRGGYYIQRLRRLARLGAQDEARSAEREPVLFESRRP